MELIFLVNCWPSSDGDGLFNMSIEYKLQNENVTLYDVVISMPFPCASGHIFILFYSDLIYTATAHIPP